MGRGDYSGRQLYGEDVTLLRVVMAHGGNYCVVIISGGAGAVGGGGGGGTGVADVNIDGIFFFYPTHSHRFFAPSGISNV